MSRGFIHLRIHSEYSLVDGMVRIKPLVGQVAKLGMPAVAVTDQCNLFSMVKFYSAALKAGIKPIIGTDLWLANDDDPNKPYRLTLLCKDQQGYRHLTEIVSQGYTEGQQRGVPIVRREWIVGKTSGLIALSGGRIGDVGRALLAGKSNLAEALLQQWCELFPDNYYLELVRTGRPGEEQQLHLAVELAAKTNTPVVATNDVCFLSSDDFEAHEVRVCINDGRVYDDPHRPRNYSEQQYLRTPEEMAELFSDIPEALENTVEIAKRCNVELTLGKYFLPDFPVPAGMTIDEYFRKVSWDGLEKRLAFLYDTQSADFPDIRKPYDERLALELDVIIQMGFPGYFLIVADFIQWAKNNGVPVGPGRGSGAGSLVAYVLTITDLDPLEYDLLFERFLNPERVSMPDFDVDFCMEGRDRVIDYVADHYGRDKVSQIITYGTMAAKAVIRDVGRVLGHPYGFVDRIAKMIPFELGITLRDALEKEPELKDKYDNDDEVHALIDMALKLEGLTRNAGKHAGGVVIGPTKLTDFCPLYCEEGGDGLVTQLDKNDVESIGLVKFDFLGLRTLTIIDWALQNIEKASGEKIDIVAIPLEDPATFDLLKACQTTAVFQLESRGMKDLIRRLQPDCFEDIIALVALFRPGPLQSGMVDNFINRKHGRESVSYPDAQYQHPSLKPILEPTYGIILYQEQVMQIAQVLAGYTLGGADMLRRAMGKKKPEEMAKQRSLFEEGSIRNGIDGGLSMKIFDLVEKFAGYGFNKSHSAAYALVSYQTAWLKTHYPAAFMAAVLSADMDNTDKVVTLIEECRTMRLKVLPPDVNHCVYRFTVVNNAILYGLGAIKGVGESAIDTILAERSQNGDFKDLFDFCRRIDLRKVNRRVIESMIRAGAFDNLGPNRATLMHNVATALQMAEQHAKNAQVGVVDMFGFESPDESEGGHYELMPDWRQDERLNGEKETLGLFLTGHPIDPYLTEMAHFASSRIADLKPARNQMVLAAGMVVELRIRDTKTGKKMAYVTLDDRSGRIESILTTRVYDEFRDVLAKDKILVIEGEVAVDDYTGNLAMRASRVIDIQSAREIYSKGLQIRMGASRAVQGFVTDLAGVLGPYRHGKCNVYIDYTADSARALIRLGEGWAVKPADELLYQLADLLGSENVNVVYN